MYSLFLGSQPQKFLKKTEKEARERIWIEIEKLKVNPYPPGVIRLVGRREKAFRVRVSKYRI